MLRLGDTSDDVSGARKRTPATVFSFQPRFPGYVSVLFGRTLRNAMTTIQRWHGTALLREHRRAWDDLWQRSSVTAPTARAEQVGLYAETFSRPDTLETLVFTDGDRLIAALPLLPQRRAGLLTCLMLPHNDWTTGAAPLIDRTWVLDDIRRRDLATVMARALMGVSHRAVFLDGLSHDKSFWRDVVAAVQEQGGYAQWEARSDIAVLPIEVFGDGMLGRLSKSTRKRLRRAEKELARRGTTALRVWTPSTWGEAEREALARALQIEHAKALRPGWTSIIGADLADFFERQAELATAHHEFLLAFLELETSDPIAGTQLPDQAESSVESFPSSGPTRRSIAFEYGWLAKGVYHSLKVGYDPAFQEYSPGHLLMGRLGRYLIERGDVTTVDCLCRADTPLARTWRCHSYPTWRLWVCRPAWLGHTLAWGIKQKRQLFRPASTAADFGPPSSPTPSPL